MPECENCGSHVTRQFVRVRFQEKRETVPGCPHCEDLTFDGEEYRKIRYK